MDNIWEQRIKNLEDSLILLNNIRELDLNYTFEYTYLDFLTDKPINIDIKRFLCKSEVWIDDRLDTNKENNVNLNHIKVILYVYSNCSFDFVYDDRNTFNSVINKVYIEGIPLVLIYNNIKNNGENVHIEDIIHSAIDIIQRNKLV